MEAAKYWPVRDCADALNNPMNWGILVQNSVRPYVIVARGIFAKYPAQVYLSERDLIVNTFSSDSADQSLRAPVLLRRPKRNRFVANAHDAEPAPDGSTKIPILISHQIMWDIIPWKSFSNLLRGSFHRWVCRDIDPGKIAPSQTNDLQNIKSDGWDHKLTHCCE